MILINTFKARGSWRSSRRPISGKPKRAHMSPSGFRNAECRPEQPSPGHVVCLESVQSGSGEGGTLDQDPGSAFTVDWVMRRAVLGEARTCVLEGCLCLMSHSIQEARWLFMWFSQLWFWIDYSTCLCSNPAPCLLPAF